jgi:exopolysaccharide biosynthesis polyprenyl glycosylphosphotransferase
MLPADPRKRRAIRQLALVDYGAAVLSWALFWAYRHPVEGANFFAGYNALQMRDIVLGLLIVPASWMALYTLSGTYFDLYRKSRLEEVARTIISCLIGSVLIALVLFANDAADYQSFIRLTGRYLLLHTVFTLIARVLLLNTIKRHIEKGQVGFNTLIIGGNDKAIEIYQRIRNAPRPLGNIFSGFIYSSRETGNGMSHHLPQLGNLQGLERIIDEHRIEEVIVAVDSSEHHLLENILTRLSYRPVVVKVLPDMYDIISGSVKTSNVYDAVLIHIYPELMPGWQQVCKRTIDILISLLALTVLLPVYLFAAIRVKLSSPGPVFYRQHRVGLYGQVFSIYKFRSMFVNAEQNGPALSSKEDPRITPWGRFMRKWRIDELPQFVNILKGDMSLVGPRPEREHFIALISQSQPHYKYLHKVRPGLTSWGMVQYGYAENVEQMIERMKYDLLYIENCSLALDIKILLYTFMVILQGRGK